MGKRSRQKKERRKEKLLDGHIRQGKELLPPLIAKLSPKLTHISWANMLLPEVLWLSLLIDAYGLEKGTDIALKLAKATNKIVIPLKSKSFAFISEYEHVKPEHVAKILDELLENNNKNLLLDALWPLISMYSECPLNIFFDKQWRDSHSADISKFIPLLSRIVSKLLDRRTKEAMFAQTTAIYIELVTGKLKIAMKDSGLEKIESIKFYPDTDESRMVASCVRSAINLPIYEDVQPSWPGYFWNHGYQISPCKISRTIGELKPGYDLQTQEELQEIVNIGIDYKIQLFNAVKKAWFKCKIDLLSPNKTEVLGGLLSRQMRLATAIMINPELWTVDIGRILLRCMVDCDITLAWLVQHGAAEDFKKFIEYGLGQEKLLLSHLEDVVEKQPEFHEIKSSLEEGKDWINTQLFTFLLPVNLASWTTKTIRQMAEETNRMDIYNLSYSPLSAVLHGSWNAIAKINLQLCYNPLHKLHRIPQFEDPPLYLETMLQANKIMEKSFTEWKTAVCIDDSIADISQKLERKINEILLRKGDHEPESNSGIQGDTKP